MEESATRPIAVYPACRPADAYALRCLEPQREVSRATVGEGSTYPIYKARLGISSDSPCAKVAIRIVSIISVRTSRRAHFARPPQRKIEMASRQTVRMRRDLLGRSRGDDATAAVATLGTEVDHPVGGLDDVEIVFDDDHGVAGVAQLVQHLEQQRNVVEVQPGGRFVEDVQGASA